MIPGDYTYTVTGIAPCPNASATITITESLAADAGSNGTLGICSTNGPVSLFAQLGGTPQAGGAWSGASAVVGGAYDPATMDPGVYTYTVLGIAPCPNSSATVVVNEPVAPVAGLDGSVAICSIDPPTSLFAQLGGTPEQGGTWAGPSVVIDGAYDPAVMTEGIYTYTVFGEAPCPNASASVMVEEMTQPDAGPDGSFTVCSTDGIQDLMEVVGVPGGTWTDPLGIAFTGSFDPAIGSTGTYTYTIPGMLPCSADARPDMIGGGCGDLLQRRACRSPYSVGRCSRWQRLLDRPQRSSDQRLDGSGYRILWCVCLYGSRSGSMHGFNGDRGCHHNCITGSERPGAGERGVRAQRRRGQQLVRGQPAPLQHSRGVQEL